MNNWMLALIATGALGAAGGAAAYEGGQRNEYGRGYDSGAYVGLSVGQLRYSEAGLDTITPATGMLTIGAALSPNLSLEGRPGAGVGRALTHRDGGVLNSLCVAHL